MKKLSSVNKFIFLINNVFAILLIISFFIPNLNPEKFNLVSILSLLTPVLIIINFAFILYWIVIGFKKQVILSFLVLLLSLLFIPKLYKFDNEKVRENKERLRIMTYNVRKFNVYQWLNITNIDNKIKDLIITENPDILCLQEYRKLETFKLNYPFNYNYRTINNVQSGLTIYSKYPIINKGSIGDERHSVDAIYADVVKNNDTIRIYNFRLESLGVIPNKYYFGHENSERLIKRIRRSFIFQQTQISLINNHINNCKHKVILTGDLNNTAYSWAYKNIKSEMKDTFIIKGNGFGKTYEFIKFPLRIDYIFVDDDITVIDHQNLRQKFSDHYPIVATLEL